jgi:DNA mismatch endonuclease, patch repair protein
MRAVKSSDTKPEKTVEQWLQSARFKALQNCKQLAGSPDFALPRRKIAIFVHGCFWHAHNCHRGSRRPKTNVAFWENKLSGNKRRDLRVKRELGRLGWRTIILWECRLSHPNTRLQLLNKIRLSPIIKKQL